VTTHPRRSQPRLRA